LTGKEKCEAALSGSNMPGTPPIIPIYDKGYIAKLSGGCARDFITAGQTWRLEATEHALLRHDVDGIFVNAGTNDDFLNNHELLDMDGKLNIYRDNVTGERFALDEDGNKYDHTGAPIQPPASLGDKIIRTKEDIKRILPSPFTMDSVLSSGFYSTIGYLSEKYPDRHFAAQIGSPIVYAVGYCGYEEMMSMLLAEPELTHQVLEHIYEIEYSKIALCKEFGAGSVWLTSYFTGTDTISPKCFREFALPYERRLAERAHDLGLKVIYWFLNDMRGIIDDIGSLPIDAILPEQPRKGYPVDMPAIRNAMSRQRCVMSYTYENHFITADKDAIRSAYEDQYTVCSGTGAFAASTTIMPSDADPSAMDMYCEIVREINM